MFFDAVMAALQLLFSVSSLVVAAWVGCAVVKSQQDQRKHNMLSVRPYFHTWTDILQNERRVTLFLENNGAGVGIVDALSLVNMKGEEYFFSSGFVHGWVESRLTPSEYEDSIIHAVSLAPEYHVRADVRIRVFNIKLPCPLCRPISETANMLADGLQIKIRYRSVYNEAFEYVASEDSTVTRRIC